MLIRLYEHDNQLREYYTSMLALELGISDDPNPLDRKALDCSLAELSAMTVGGIAEAPKQYVQNIATSTMCESPTVVTCM